MKQKILRSVMKKSSKRSTEDNGLGRHSLKNYIGHI